MNRLLFALCLAALVGCGGTSSGYLPVDSPLTKFVPPDPADLVEDPEDTMDDVEEEDWGDVGEDWGDVGESPESESPGSAIDNKDAPKSPKPADAR